MRRPELVALVALAACGGRGGENNDDAAGDHDGGFVDAAVEPAPPTLGPQLDRAGRPLVRTMLIGTFSPTTQTALREAYDKASDASMWKSTLLQPNLTISKEIAANMAALDAFDAGQIAIVGRGCGNTVLYGPQTNASSYNAAADLFADDQIYVDTAKPTCSLYLELEIQHVSAGTYTHASCGGRVPTYDVVDMTYSVLTAGINGLLLAQQLAPRIKDGVSAHADVKDTFPFLGNPR